MAEPSRRPLDEMLLDLTSAVPVRSLWAVYELRLWVEEVQDRAVARARADGMNWAEIGRALRLSRQAVRQRYAGRDLPDVREPHENRELLLRWFALEERPRPEFGEWARQELGLR